MSSKMIISLQLMIASWLTLAIHAELGGPHRQCHGLHGLLQGWQAQSSRTSTGPALLLPQPLAAQPPEACQRRPVPAHIPCHPRRGSGPQHSVAIESKWCCIELLDAGIKAHTVEEQTQHHDGLVLLLQFRLYSSLGTSKLWPLVLT